MFKYKTDRTPLTQYSTYNWRQRRTSRRCPTQIVLITKDRSLSQKIIISSGRTRYTLIRLSCKPTTTHATRIIYRAIKFDSSDTKIWVTVNKMERSKQVSTKASKRNCSNTKSIHLLVWTWIMVITAMMSMHSNQIFNNKRNSYRHSSFLKETRDMLT